MGRDDDSQRIGIFQSNAGYHADVVEGGMMAGRPNFWLAGVQ
jgi:hypothetical protein